MGDGPNNDDSAPDFSFLGDEGGKPLSDDTSAAGSQPVFQQEDSGENPPAPKKKKLRKPVARKVTGNSDASRKAAHPGSSSAPKTSTKAAAQPADNAATETESAIGNVVPQKWFAVIAGYAIALTLLFLVLWMTGRLSLSGNHQLESLPDIKPLSKGEFQSVPGDASLPPGHELKLGESQRFGDIIITPTRVTRDVVMVASATRAGEPPEQRTQAPVLKLWFEVKNVSHTTAFAPWDVGLMCHRSPEYGNDETTLANSWLRLAPSGGGAEGVRVLNYLHPPGSPFALIDQNSGQVLQPGETVTTFVACAEEIQQLFGDDMNELRWRLQLRKGVNQSSGNGVTTLVDVTFDAAQVQTGDA